MSQHITVINAIDIAPVLECYNKIEHGIVWTDYGHKGRQTGIQYKDVEDPWSSAVGKSRGQERTYTNTNPYFAGTIFEELVREYKLSRARLMWVGPYACYSMHRDTTPRIHIPLITNPACYFVFKLGVIEHMPVGSVYKADTTRLHTFMNCSNEHRLHLVGVVE